MEEVSNEVDLLPADKHESLLQTNTMILAGMVKHSQGCQNSRVILSLSMGINKHSQST